MSYMKEKVLMKIIKKDEHDENYIKRRKVEDHCHYT